MIKSIAIVSLSRGIVGEPFMEFEVEIGLRRLKELGLNVKFMPHALKGLKYVQTATLTSGVVCCDFDLWGSLLSDEDYSTGVHKLPLRLIVPERLIVRMTRFVSRM